MAVKPVNRIANPSNFASAWTSLRRGNIAPPNEIRKGPGAFGDPNPRRNHTPPLLTSTPRVPPMAASTALSVRN
jgi:hypothetical protein